MLTWYIPSWNGDLRLTPDPKDSGKSLLSIVRPTASEKQLLLQLQETFVERGWLSPGDKNSLSQKRSFWNTAKVTILAPVAEIGLLISSIAKPGENVLTAVRMNDGRIEVCQTNKLTVPVAASNKPAAEDPPKTAATPPEPKSEPSDQAKEIAAKPEAKVAATVKRATPCCPDCYVDAIKPSTEVLLSFLNEEQHRTWAKDRFVTVQGRLSGHRYLIAHRNSPIAAQNGRIAHDLDDGQTMHFHDWTVPPEEEVLGAMLILEHREPWLRNEATCLGTFTDVFKNPFGHGGDGVPDSVFTREIGYKLGHALWGNKRPRGPKVYTGWSNGQPLYVDNANYA